MTNQCQDCQRHTSKHPELFNLLKPEQQSDLQIQLCAGHESGDCRNDPFK